MPGYLFLLACYAAEAAAPSLDGAPLLMYSAAAELTMVTSISAGCARFAWWTIRSRRASELELAVGMFCSRANVAPKVFGALPRCSY